MDLKKNAAAIEAGRTALGLELGSTNIKMVLVNEACETLASTSYGWENQLENGIWTYDLATVASAARNSSPLTKKASTSSARLANSWPTMPMPEYSLRKDHPTNVRRTQTGSL